MLCADLLKVSAKGLREAVRRGCESFGYETGSQPSVDVVIGGPPCQGFSVGGKLQFDDERNRLVFAFARAVGFLKPRYFVMENVPAIRSAQAEVESGIPGTRGSLLNALFREFDRLGYDVCEEEVLNACDFGVPQDRRRVILIGALRGQPEPHLPVPTVQARPKRASESRPASALPLGPSVDDAIGDLPNLDAYEELLTSDEVRIDPARSPLGTASRYARGLRRPSSDREDLSYRRRWNSRLLTSSLRTTHTAVTAKRFAATEPGQAEQVSRFYRLDPEGLCSTLRAGTGYERGSFSAPRPIHPHFARVISVREAARLQSFPDWFRFHATKWHGFRQVGNALPPLLARALGRAIIEALDVHAVRPSETLALGDSALLRWGMREAAENMGADLAAPSHADRTRTRGKGLAEGTSEELLVA